jgi:hypothetical protein
LPPPSGQARLVFVDYRRPLLELTGSEHSIGHATSSVAAARRAGPAAHREQARAGGALGSDAGVGRGASPGAGGEVAARLSDAG